MPESRDRLPRVSEEDSIIASYSQRRISRTSDRNIGSGTSIAFVLEDDNEEGQAVVRTPFRWRDMPMVGNPSPIGVAVGSAIRTPRIRPENMSPVLANGRIRGGAFVTPIRRIAPLMGPENLSPVVETGRGGSVLPSWYPRRPLNDITAIVRAMERRRERRGVGEGIQTESLLTQGGTSQDYSVMSTPGAHLGSKIATVSTFSKKRCPPTIGKVPKILLNITHHNQGDADCLTPQKQLLNNIDIVEKVVMEELRKLKRTPSAKKAEREKRVRTLMSMR